VTGHPLRPGDIVRIRDEGWHVLRHVLGANGSLLEVRGRDRGNRQVRTCFLLPCEPCERIPQSTLPRVVRPRTWCRRVRAALAAATPALDSIRTPPAPTLVILPFQLEPALAVLRGLSSRILIADEVGLGKTVQAGLVISEVLRRRSTARALVVTPAGLRGQWREELHERLALDGCVLDSAALARTGWPSMGNPWAAHPIVITSLDYVKRPEVLRSLEALIWDIVVFDEAHAIAGQSDRAAAARGLADRARTVLLLTATPHSGDDEAFARLCATGDLRRQFPLLVFRRTRRDVGLATQRRTVSMRVRPTLAEVEMHRAVAAYARLVWAQKGASSAGARFVASMLSRRACSSAASLARSVDRRLTLLARTEDPTPQPLLPFDEIESSDEEPSALLSTPGLHDEKKERLMLERLLELARRAALRESKLQALRRWLRRAREPAIVFTEYRDTLATLAGAVSTFEPVLLHGGLTTAERHEAAGAFNGGRTSLLLATDAASEGLNLHHRCRLVINLELPWTPVRLEQRVGRVDRIGQTRRVHAVHLLAAGTIEEDSVARLILKSARIARAVGSLRPADDGEASVAATAIGGRQAEKQRGTLSPPSLNAIAGDLRSAAEAEAARLEMVRRLTEGRLKADPTYDTRPSITVLKRRAGHRTGLWIYRLAMADADGQFVWDTLLGIGASLDVDTRSTRDLRAWVVASNERLTSVVCNEHQRVISDAARSTGAPLTLATRREHAIAETLTNQRARLAAMLLQGGLFDRRAERAAAAQTAVVDEALSRSAARLRELEQLARLTPEPVDIRFAAQFR
jgi:ERCC4-related helicase